jgi:hypothetical protein
MSSLIEGNELIEYAKIRSRNLHHILANETAKKLTYLLSANYYLPLEFGEDDVELLRKLG